MSKSFGLPTSSQFMIGNFEFRVGTLNQAGRLTRQHSVGIVDGFTLNTQINKTDLMASTPRRVVDTAVTSMLSSISVNMREYSARNLRMLLSEGVQNYSDYTLPLTYTGTTTAAISPITTNTSVVLPLSSSNVSGTSIASQYTTTLVTLKGTDVTPVTQAIPALTSATAVSSSPVSGTAYKDVGLYLKTLTTGTGSDAKPVTLKNKLNVIFTATANTEYVVTFKVTSTATAAQGVSVTAANVDDTLSTVTTGNLSRSGLALTGAAAKSGTTFSFLYTPASDNGSLTLTITGNEGVYISSVEVKTRDIGLNAGDTVTVLLADDILNPVVTTVTANMAGSSVSVQNLFPNPVAVGTKFSVYRNEAIGAGNMDSSKRFFTASLVQMDRTGKIPLVYDFWKCALSSGLDMSIDTTQFASTQLQLKVLKPMGPDYGYGGPLSHVADEISNAPTWRYSSLPSRVF